MMARASESEVKDIGREIFRLMKGETPSVFNKDWWSGKVMDLSMKDEAFKVEMFRFVDVFPTLRNPVQVAEHLQAYFCRPEQNFPASFQWGLGKVKPDSMVAKMAAKQIEKQTIGMAKKFIAGTNAAEAIPTLEKMWKKQGLAFTLDLLGEATVSEDEAGVYVERYNEIMDTLTCQTEDWPREERLESASWGRVPRVNVSVKVSSLFSQIDPIDFQGSIDAVKERLRPLFRKAKATGGFVNLDMEQYAYKDLTIGLFKSILEEPEFVDFEDAGIALQAYLRDAPNDVRDLSVWAKKRKTPVTVRLIKGAYWDYETIHSGQMGWGNPVWSHKWETDACFETCTQILLDHAKWIHCAIGSHNVRSIAHAMGYAKARKVPPSDLEFQMLYGMAEPMKSAITKMGYRVREYVPIGEMIPGMAYLVRRLLENTSNESWLRHSYADGYDLEQLLGAPSPGPGMVPTTGTEHLGSVAPNGFQNHPTLDFSSRDNREHVQKALSLVQAQCGRHYPLVVNGVETTTSETLSSVNPSRHREVVGTVSAADIPDAERAVAACLQASKDWSQTSAQARATLVERAADIMARRRAELVAWMVLEVGKNYREADNDVCEAIDFCRYYALEMRRLEKPQQLGEILGESNLLFYKPRGVCAVIAPWNFPLAILAGMTMAAAVTGNTVIMKPAEQSSVIAAKWMEVIVEAGFPKGVIHFLPGRGEVVGRHLVESPDVDVIAFTGSMQVGLEIIRQAGHTIPGQRSVKKVVCEMGGKNAIIIDADADLDEAVIGVMQSAFGFQGQKCSACSRVIVEASCYDEFRSRLVAATQSLVMGRADDCANFMGPVIDMEAFEKVRRYVEIGAAEGTLLVGGDGLDGGYFVRPTIIEGIRPEHRLAQEEIFGPVLAMMRAEDFDDALRIAGSTPFALTAGIYSRNPLHLDRARKELEVGNLYINRNCTGALVFRQPFGGFKMSGVGTKAGGPDYLLNFLEPRTITENTMRRGFAPMDD
jgi:RHH-type transcriptional regulator, proline utilization regulon repressor / proline dehydrogenase / delta 1-pyrroline-5-carboxylate dehydrogenase